MEKVIQTTDNETFVHLVHPMMDVTICGNALEGDTDRGAIHISRARTTKKKINCPKCIQIIKCCNKASESL